MGLSTENHRDSSCGTCKAKICTSFYGVTWALLILGGIWCHIAVGQLIGPLGSLPDNLEKGFKEVLKFNKLSADAAAVKNASETAIAKCGEQPSECGQFTSSGAIQDTTAEKAQIDAAFDSSLSIIKKVASDKYFGTSQLNSTATNLENILTQLSSFNASTAPCAVSTSAYCEIKSYADAIVDGTAEVEKQIDDFVKNDFVTDFKNHKDKLMFLHAVPYILCLSMLFFFCFWWKDATCCLGCGGSKRGCCFLIFFKIFWLISIVLFSIIFGVGYLFKNLQDQVPLDSAGLKGEPTLKDVLDHIDVEYADFKATVITPLEGPLERLYEAAFVFNVVCLLIYLYGCCVCCWRPYYKKGEAGPAMV